YSLMPNSTHLYAGGAFRRIGGINANRIAKWSEGVWSALGSGMGGGDGRGILGLDSSGSELFAVGYFPVAGAASSVNVALWHIPHSLSILRSGRNLTLSWPATGTNFVLEATSDLGEANWQGVSGIPSIVNDQCVVTLAPGPGHQFFRLRRK